MSKTKIIRDTQRIALVVLGMHRSGTSALSGSLSLLGYGLPATLAPADHNNRHGYFESKALWGVNDDLLAEIGSGWNDWTSVDLAALPTGLYKRSLKRATEIVQTEYRHCDGPVILKDPRMCRLMPLWIEALSGAGFLPHVVHIHRHPLEVAASVQRRDGYDPAFGLLMWLCHVLEAEHASRNLPRCFTSFNLLMQDWRQTTETIHQRLDLPLPPLQDPDKTPVEGFLSTGLRHFTTADPATDSAADPATKLGVWWQSCFDILEQWALTGETPGDHDRLDKIGLELAALPPQFPALIRPGQLALVDRAEQADVVKIQSQTLDRLSASLAEKAAEGLKLQEDISARDHILETQSQNLDQLSVSLAEKDAEGVKRQEDISARDRILETQSQNLDRLRASLTKKDAEELKRQEDMRALDRILETQAGNLDRLRADNAHLHQNVARAEYDYHEVLRSTSWRLTAPLRYLIGLLRRK